MESEGLRNPLMIGLVRSKRAKRNPAGSGEKSGRRPRTVSVESLATNLQREFREEFYGGGDGIGQL